ncbi:MAG: ankyrin repeat domain-containing protein [Gemmatimonadota bacterium]|nr:ankyrin repeat domain-containing protein [Gemmatimonadota bacterium]
MTNPASPLPARPSLEQLRKQAKQLLRQYRTGDRAAVARVHAQRVRADHRVALADAQLVLARELGFASWARLKHHVEAVQRPADYDEPVWGRDTWPFLVAVYQGDETAVREMLVRDPLLARAEYAYLQPLHYAVRGGRASMVRLLLDAGADPLAEGWSGRFGAEARDDTPLARARDREQQEIVALLETAAAHPLPAKPERTAALTPQRALEDEMMKICHRGEIAAAEEMMRRHPGIAQAGLYEAVHQDHPELVRLLLANGARAATPWRWACWYTPLMHSLRYPTPRYATAQLLLDHGVSPNETNGMGMTALHILAAEGTTAAATWLLDRGADLHTHDREFESAPLAWAARAGRADMVELLLSRGAAPVHPDDEPWAMPIAWARRRHHEQIVAQLAAQG